MLATIAKEQRQERILLTLKKLGFLSRSQIQRLHRLGGDRNANRILSDMNDYLHAVRLDEKVYYLNAAGRERVGATKVLKKTHQITHHLMRNSLYIAQGCPSSWKVEVKLAVKNEVTVIADALFTMADRYFICEVDNTQRMAENKAKIAKYRHLIALGVFKKQPKFIWITTTEYRRKQLEKMCEGLDARIYTRGDLDV
ncbi:replication-relaxation family protein [Bacillus mesophilum]|uniref:Replication-relaxation n=1 Tax=Bacillus mesophilum TaxID=1071718 RepID=A0A7V7UVM2_9BACI|nr:replication-relaxation family protein [Bacillus mesophilum]KAB2332917.1 hypothetical protein F7732_12610 [Bacillus mesophilum]